MQHLEPLCKSYAPYGQFLRACCFRVIFVVLPRVHISPETSIFNKQVYKHPGLMLYGLWVVWGPSLNFLPQFNFEH